MTEPREPFAVSWLLGVLIVLFIAVAAFGWLLGWIPEHQAVTALGAVGVLGLLYFLLIAL